MALYCPPKYHTSGINWPFSSREAVQNTFFQNEGCNGPLGFLTATILAIFDLHVTRILPTTVIYVSIGTGKNN